MRTEASSRLNALVAWVAIPLAGALWHLHHLRGTWYFFDEWSVIERVSHRGFVQGVTTGFNGHLWMPTDVLYRAQVSVFGVDRHAFVIAAYVLVLVALDVAIAAVLRAGGAPLLVALLTAALVTYLGVAGQNVLFVVQASSMLAMALCAGATALVLLRPPTRATVAIVGGVLLCAVAADSGYALSGIVLASIVALLTWRWRRAWPALVPAIVAEIAWHAFGDLGPRWPGTLGTRVSFCVRLLLVSTGGLIGRAAVLPGAVVLLIAVALIGVGWRRGLITGAPRTLLLAGTPATLLTIAALAQSRAGLVGANLYDSNRYLAGVAIPLVIALVPACAASVRGFARPLLAPIAPVLIALAFVGGLAPLRHYRASFVGANVAVRTAAASAAIVVRDGCPSGAAPDPASTPAGALSPQMNTALITELMRRGALHAPTEGDADPAVVARLCPP